MHSFVAVDQFGDVDVAGDGDEGVGFCRVRRVWPVIWVERKSILLRTDLGGFGEVPRSRTITQRKGVYEDLSANVHVLCDLQKIGMTSQRWGDQLSIKLYQDASYGQRQLFEFIVRFNAFSAIENLL